MRALLLATFVAVSCSTSGGAPNGPDASEQPAAPSSSAQSVQTLSLSVAEAKYGSLVVRTDAGARCGAVLQVRGGTYGDLPPGTLAEQTAGADGILTWTYSAPRVPAGTAAYTVKCQTSVATESRSGVFTIPTHPLTPTSFAVRVTTDEPPRLTYKPDPSLVPLRDAALAKMRATLATEWTSATRGLGALQIVDQSADITVHVIAARGTSVHREDLNDDSQDVLLYVSGETGPRSVENNVAVALHELGHIWCCDGPGTSEGHWTTKETSPGLYGVDKYGLMTDPVTCFTFGTIISCPNRFSDREMLALGFTSFPPPLPDPCITQGLSLRSQINTIKAQLASLNTQIRAIETQYPRGIPQSIYASYVSLVDQYNALVGRERSLVTQLNALPCDSS